MTSRPGSDAAQSRTFAATASLVRTAATESTRRRWWLYWPGKEDGTATMPA
ncbi:hypothetical protein [Streptomyces sp. NPDC093598]|uniref:hypothetical protein n=1 Tax=Streptomyces sp. NPDC093598 TaxID=3366046 RepID=UPI0037F462C3